MGTRLSPGCRTVGRCRTAVGRCRTAVGLLSDRTVGLLSDCCRTVGPLSDCCLPGPTLVYCRTAVGLLSDCRTAVGPLSDRCRTAVGLPLTVRPLRDAGDRYWAKHRTNGLHRCWRVGQLRRVLESGPTQEGAGEWANSERCQPCWADSHRIGLIACQPLRMSTQSHPKNSTPPML